MKRTIACRMDGENVVQTTTVLNDDGSLHSERTITLGNRETVLAHLEGQVSEAKRDRDGATSPLSSKPGAGDGAAGESVEFYLDGKNLNRVKTVRNSNGKLRSQDVEPLGPRSEKLAHFEERFTELTAVRDAVAGAK